MYLKGLATAVPEYVFRQGEVWELVRRAERFSQLANRSQALVRKVLTGDSGIEERRFAVSDPAGLFEMDAGELNARFEQAAPELAERAVREACERAGLRVEELDALLVCSCTGYLCPGVSSYVSERCGLRGGAFLQDVVGYGCGAAIPMWRAAEGFLAANPGSRVATVAVEVCSLAFYLDDDPGVLISACLFGDGAAAAIWTGRGDEGDWKAGNFGTLHLPEEREKIRFVNERGFLKNQLHRSVPKLAGEAVRRLWDDAEVNPDAVLSHSGGRDVIEVVEGVVNVGLPETREVMRKYGNCSSPSVMMALEERMRQNGSAGDLLWLTSFGAGFSAHCCELKRG